MSRVEIVEEHDDPELPYRTARSRLVSDYIHPDRPMLQHALNDADIPYIAFKYAENSGQMQPIREQAGTFADSIMISLSIHRHG